MANKKGSDGRYRYRVCIGKDETGKPKYKSFYGSTAKAARAAAEAYRTALGKGMDPAQSKATLATLYDNLIAAKTAKGIGQKSLDRYEDNKNHWGPLLDQPAADLRTADFQRVVQYNPIVKTTCPAGADPEHREPITEEQQQWIRETPHRAQRAAMLLLYSGLRRGEATALTWADVDLKEATITVHSGYNFKDKKIKDPKTEAGVRVVNIPKILVDYLKTQQDDCLYVLHTVKGHRMTEQAWKTLWSSYMADLNAKYGYHGEESKKRPGGLPMRIEPFTPHQLRHTFCTLMYFAGVDVLTARDQMGHKDISVTLGIYTSLDKKFKKKKINRLDSYLKKQTG